MASPIHDFRESDLYPKHASLPAWRWEFLRRNGDYQAAFAHHGNTQPPHSDCLRFGLRTWPDPAREWQQVMSAFRMIAGVTELPTLETLERWMQRDDFDPLVTLHSLLETFTEWRATGMRVALIDVALPIGDQVDKIESMLSQRTVAVGETVVPKLDRARMGTWRDYVRVLDGYAAGFDPAQIAAALYPWQPNDHASGHAASKKVRIAYNRALELCEGFGIPRVLLEK